MTPAGEKLHRIRTDGKTVCGYSMLQMVLVEDPPPGKMLCEWCEAS